MEYGGLSLVVYIIRWNIVAFILMFVSSDGIVLPLSYCFYHQMEYCGLCLTVCIIRCNIVAFLLMFILSDGIQWPFSQCLHHQMQNCGFSPITLLLSQDFGFSRRLFFIPFDGVCLPIFYCYYCQIEKVDFILLFISSAVHSEGKHMPREEGLLMRAQRLR